MRIAKNIFLILGILCILFEILGYIGSGRIFIPPGNLQSNDTAEQIGGFIGYNLFLIMGLIFLLLSNRYRKKIARKKDKNLVDSLFADQEEVEK